MKERALATNLLRPSLMTAEELCTLGQQTLGRGWQKALAKRLEVHVVTVSRWSTGRLPISKPTAIAIRHVLGGGR